MRAEAQFRDLITRWPNSPNGYDGLAQLALRAGQNRAAVAWFTEAARRDPDRAARYNNLSLACYRHGDYPAAEGAARQALRLDPGYAAAWNNLGNAYLGQEQPALSRAAYREALRCQRGYVKAWLNLARVELQLTRPEAAVRAARQALRYEAQASSAWGLLAQAEQGRRRFPEALAAVKTALQHQPDDLELRKLKGSLLRDTFQPEAAITLLQDLARRLPNDQGVWNELGMTLDTLNRLPEAAAAFDRAIAALAAEGRRLGETRVELRPEAMTALHFVRFNRTMNFLKQGDFAQGWAEYFHRWNGRDRDFDREFGVPRWQGQALDGQHVILATEQGLGDSLQFLRYLPLLRERARPARVTLATVPALADLLADQPGIDAMVLPDHPLPHRDHYILLIDLPYWFETRLSSIPAKTPYLHLAPERLAPWRQRLAALQPGVRVGLAWQGNPTYGQDHFRSYPLRACQPLFDLPGIQWIQLQRHTGVEQLAECHAEGLEIPLRDLGQERLSETAAVIAGLDLVITPDSMLAHLAGALGREVWAPLSMKGEWRWLTERSDSPWYPTLRLFRQTRPGDWASALAPLRTALVEWLAARA